METRAFHLGDVLSVTTGILMSPRLIDGVYDILNFMTGDDLYTHQLPRACRQVAPEILKQYPALAAIDLPAMAPDEVAPMLARLVAEHGETFALTPMQGYASMDPLGELMSITDKQIVVVEPQEPK